MHNLLWCNTHITYRKGKSSWVVVAVIHWFICFSFLCHKWLMDPLAASCHNPESRANKSRLKFSEFTAKWGRLIRIPWCRYITGDDSPKVLIFFRWVGQGLGRSWDTPPASCGQDGEEEKEEGFSEAAHGFHHCKREAISDTLEVEAQKVIWGVMSSWDDRTLLVRLKVSKHL
jgi:hypothetical protein